MALLDMSKNYFDYIEVAHVNYHKRDTATRDEKIVKKYCKDNKIKFHKLDVEPSQVSGNFQAYAREARYKYFSNLCKKNKLDGVLVAHHMDDLIETYLMQMDKKLSVNYYGLSPAIYLYYVFVNRPLLDYTKQDLVNYCENNNIVYGIDESNLTNHYTRNKVRHNKVEKMSLAQKKKIVKEINAKNQKNIKALTNIVIKIDKKKDYTVKQFLNIKDIKLGLRVLFGNKSDKFFEEMLRQIKDGKKYYYKGESFSISKEYDRVHIFETVKPYSYKFNNLRQLKSKEFKYFKIAKTGKGTEALTLSKTDFPISIASCSGNESIAMHFGSKKVNRFFIDNKILIKDRLSWPIVKNNKEDAILVPNLGCDVNHYSKKPNLYVIKL